MNFYEYLEIYPYLPNNYPDIYKEMKRNLESEWKKLKMKRNLESEWKENKKEEVFEKVPFEIIMENYL